MLWSVGNGANDSSGAPTINLSTRGGPVQLEHTYCSLFGQLMTKALEMELLSRLGEGELCNLQPPAICVWVGTLSATFLRAWLEGHQPS